MLVLYIILRIFPSLRRGLKCPHRHETRGSCIIGTILRQLSEGLDVKFPALSLNNQGYFSNRKSFRAVISLFVKWRQEYLSVGLLWVQNGNTFAIALQTIKNLALLKYFKTVNYIIFDVLSTISGDWSITLCPKSAVY